jgi:hypothetical protein
MGGDVMWQVDAASPGSGGASPYLRRSFALYRGRGFPPILVVLGLGRETAQWEKSTGVTSCGRLTRQAPVRAEPHPTSGGASPSTAAGASRPSSSSSSSALAVKRLGEKNLWEVASCGRLTRQAPVRAEPHPTSGGASPYAPGLPAHPRRRPSSSAGFDVG